MSEHHPITYDQPPDSRTWPISSSTCNAMLQLATLGAVIGASAAAGANIRRVQRDEVSTGEALVDTGRAAVTAAAASAIAGAAAAAVSNEGLTRLGILFATGTAVSYTIQRRWVED
jgi:hypothetical protein